MEKRYCFVVGAGEQYDMPVLPDASAGDFCIAADGGYEVLRKKNIFMDLIVGDFDSLGYVPCGDNVKVYSPKKDDTDMAIAVDYGLENGYKDFVIYGGLGKRLDHTLGNIDVLTNIAKRGHRGYLMGDKSVVTVIKDSIAFNEAYEGVISIFVRGNIAKGVNISGFKYELNNGVMEFDKTRGVSNEFIGKVGNISVSDGYLLVIFDFSKDNVLPGF